MLSSRPARVAASTDNTLFVSLATAEAAECGDTSVDQDAPVVYVDNALGVGLSVSLERRRAAAA